LQYIFNLVSSDSRRVLVTGFHIGNDIHHKYRPVGAVLHKPQTGLRFCTSKNMT